METTRPIRLGVLGRGISYSRSPAIHTKLAEERGINLNYSLYDKFEWELPEFLEEFWDVGGAGLSVTTPYKETLAKLLGSKHRAINTIYRGTHGWQATSTDGEGFFLALYQQFPQCKGMREFTFLGAGGAVVSILEHLNDMVIEDVRVNILRRSSERDLSFASLENSRLDIHFEEFDPQVLSTILECRPDQLLVQASSAPHQGQDLSEFIPALAPFKGVFVDLCYNPASALYAHCRKHGIASQDGYPMLKAQAELAQKLWFDASVCQ